MGGGSSKNELKPSSLEHCEKLLNEYNILRENEEVDIRSVCILLWKGREHPELALVLRELMIERLYDKHFFQSLEFYLPQIVHLLIHLEVEWSNDRTILETFVLLLSQQSPHLGLRLIWTLAGAIEDYQPELNNGKRNPNYDAQLYIRSTSLLDEVESAIVFANPRFPQIQELYKNRVINKQEFLEICTADRKFLGSEIANSTNKDMCMHTGVLYYKRSVKRGALHRNRWIKRWFVIQHRVLWCFHLKDPSKLKRAIPLRHTEVLEDSEVGNKFTFELREFGSIRARFRLAAGSSELREQWINVMRREGSSPPVISPYLDMNSEGLRSNHIARYGFLKSELEFVKRLTDICEELRFLDRENRTKELQQRLSHLQLPGCIYLPTCDSTAVWKRVFEINYIDAKAFSTKERCPCLVSFSVFPEAGRNTDVATYLNAALEYDKPVGKADENNDIEKEISERAMAEQNISQTSLRRFTSASVYSLTDEERQLLEDIDVCASINSDLWLDEEDSKIHSHSIKGNHSSVRFKNDDPGENDGPFSPVVRAKIKPAVHRALIRNQYTQPGRQPSEVIDAVSVAAEKALNENIIKNGTNIKETRNKSRIWLSSLGKYVEIEIDENETSGSLARFHSSDTSQISKIIAKSNDDLRQEVFIMQLITYLRDIWLDAGLSLYLRPYKILSTCKDCGILEFLDGTNSFDGIKKSSNLIRFVDYFKLQYGEGVKLEDARRCFTESLAGYSLATYILGIKDRHNGNIMLELDTGRIVHIDFGFVFGMAPGKDKIPHTDFSFEKAPFKLTSEMVEVIGGVKSENWQYFLKMISDGLIVARKHLDTLITLVEIMGFKSTLPCFNQPGGGVKLVVKQLQKRMHNGVPDHKIPKIVKQLVKKSNNNNGTLFYEWFQLKTNGLAPIY